MNRLNFSQMEAINGGAAVVAANVGDGVSTDGSILRGACHVVSAGSAVYTIGGLANWWNPIGWVSGTLAAVSLGCEVAFALSNDRSLDSGVTNRSHY